MTRPRLARHAATLALAACAASLAHADEPGPGSHWDCFVRGAEILTCSVARYAPPQRGVTIDVVCRERQVLPSVTHQRCEIIALPRENVPAPLALRH